MSLFVTIHPFAGYLSQIIRHAKILGLRFNSAIPFSETPQQIIETLKKMTQTKELWIDLKCRELRIAKDTIVPTEPIQINHKIEVKVPTAMYFNEGQKYLIINNVIDGTKLEIKPPKNVKDFQVKFGKGASINIPDQSLKVQGYLTENDIKYIKASNECGVHNFMISFVEKLSDIEDVLKLDPEAKLVAKIESKNGLEFIKKDYEKYKKIVRLMAARGDLYLEINRPHEILKAIELIIKKDPDAIFASRILLSTLKPDSIPTCSDICDVGFGIKMGYKRFLLGDEICENENALKNSIGILDQILKDFS